jgi:site-specific recombinase XerC
MIRRGDLRVHAFTIRDGAIERLCMCLRHSFGTAMAGAGVPMRTVLEWLGHRDFATTLIYSDYAPSEHEREWVEAAFTRGRLVHPGVPGRTAGSPPTDDESQT